MAKAKRIDQATVRTTQGVEVTLLAMDDGSLAIVAPSGTTAWSVVSLFSGGGGTRLRLMPRDTSANEEIGEADLQNGDAEQGNWS